MKKNWLTLMLIFLSFSIFSQNLEEVLKKHFENKGQQHLNDFETMIIKGKSIQQGQESSYTLMVKRPGKMRLEIDMQGQKFIQLYNGNSAWSVMPWTGSKEPVELTGAQLYGIQQMSDMDGPLYNWKEKAYDVKLLGTEEVKGKPAYHISAHISEDMQVDYYIGKENYMILKEEFNLKIQNQQVNQINYHSDYRPVQGVMMSFAQETGTTNRIIRTSEVVEVEFGTEISDQKFDKPPSAN